MATGYDKEEFRRQMGQLEQSMASLGQGRGEQGKSSVDKSQSSSQESFHETREHQFREPRHPKPDDEKDFFYESNEGSNSRSISTLVFSNHSV